MGRKTWSWLVWTSVLHTYRTFQIDRSSLLVCIAAAGIVCFDFICRPRKTVCQGNFSLYVSLEVKVIFNFLAILTFSSILVNFPSFLTSPGGTSGNYRFALRLCGTANFQSSEKYLGLHHDFKYSSRSSGIGGRHLWTQWQGGKGALASFLHAVSDIEDLSNAKALWEDFR